MRSISQIYAEAASVRNNYLQLTELSLERSKSKMSIINVLTYVMSALIYTYETILGAFEVRVADIINSRVNGTGLWYAAMAKKFQYNSTTGTNDTMEYNEDTLNIEYSEEDEDKRIITNAVYQEVGNTENETAIYLKVCKANEDTEEVNNGTAKMPLTESELTAFKEYIKQIKFIGAVINCISLPADILTIRATESCPIYYDDGYVTTAQALELIRAAVVDFVANFEYNGYLHYQSVVDVLQGVNHISEITSGLQVTIKTYDDLHETYNDEVAVVNRTRLKSGYLKILDENGDSTINTGNIRLLPKSSLS